MNPLIEVSELLQIISSPLVIVDASGTPGAAERFEKQHLTGALFMDLNTQLSAVKGDAADGGRHPLPAPEKFGEILGQSGITPESRVIIYDHSGGVNAAARLWWMLKSIGHENVQVVNGGFQKLLEAELPMESGAVRPVPTAPYPVNHWKLPISSLEAVIEASTKKSEIIVDVRESRRYAGIEEPLDLIAGHIPNAINIPLSNNLNSDGTFKSPTDLQETYRNLLDSLKNEAVIVHCGSGVTACHTILALAHAGLPLPALYVGSWSEWSRNHLPMVMKSEG